MTPEGRDIRTLYDPRDVITGYRVNWYDVENQESRSDVFCMVEKGDKVKYIPCNEIT